MDLQPTYNEFGSPVKLYRLQTKTSGTTYNSRLGFLAGDYRHAENFPSLNCVEQRSIVEDYSKWSLIKRSPFISTTSNLKWVFRTAERIKQYRPWELPLYIAEISPGRAVSGTICYYRWFELVAELDADVEYKAMNYHETVFLGRIPLKAITWYGRLEEAERHSFEDEEEDDDSEEDEYDEDDEDEDEDDSEEGDGPLFYPSIIVFIY